MQWDMQHVETGGIGEKTSVVSQYCAAQLSLFFRHLVRILSYFGQTSPVYPERQKRIFKLGRLGKVHPHRLSLHIHRKVVVSGYGFPITPGASVFSG